MVMHGIISPSCSQVKGWQTDSQTGGFGWRIKRIGAQMKSHEEAAAMQSEDEVRGALTGWRQPSAGRRAGKFLQRSVLTSSQGGREALIEWWSAARLNITWQLDSSVVWEKEGSETEEEKEEDVLDSPLTTSLHLSLCVCVWAVKEVHLLHFHPLSPPPHVSLWCQWVPLQFSLCLQLLL